MAAMACCTWSRLSIGLLYIGHLRWVGGKAVLRDAATAQCRHGVRWPSQAMWLLGAIPSIRTAPPAHTWPGRAGGISVTVRLIVDPASEYGGWHGGEALNIPIQPRNEAKCSRPKRSPTRAQVTELIPSANENKVTKRTMCQNPPLLNTSTPETQALQDDPGRTNLLF